MNNIITIFEIFSIVFDAILMINFISIFNHYRIKQTKLLWILFPILCIIPLVVNVTQKFSMLDIVLSIFFSFLFLIPYSNHTMVYRLFSCVLFYSLLMIINTLILYLFSIITGFSVYDLVINRSLIRIMIIILAKLILFLCTRIILFFLPKAIKSYKEYLNLLFLLAISFLNCLIVYILITLTLHFDLSIQKSLLMSLGTVGVLAEDLIFYYFFTIVNNKLKLESDNDILQRQVNYQKDHLKEMKGLYDEAHLLKHDMKQHLQCIIGYISKQDSNGALKYIFDISNEINKIYTYVNTSSEILNFIINIKLSIAQQKNIEIVTKIDEELSGLKIKDFDLCAMLGNMLDNAIDASELESNPFISIEIQRYKGYTMFTIKNRTKNANEICKGALHTTKGDSHGWGIKQIKSIINKYSGTIDIYEDKGLFCIRALFPLEPINI